jgi:hypothetical protein
MSCSRGSFAGRFWVSGHIRILFVAALALVATVSSGCKTRSSSASEGPQKAPAQAHSGPTPALHLVCPPLGAVLLPAPPNEGHRVILRWKPSRHADARHSDAVGYCIYRGPKPKAPPTELINHLPFSATQCVDDSVENGKQYYYVVRAISARGVTSDVSKPPAPAKIPNTPPVSFQSPRESIPLCRESPALKGP